MDSLTPEALAFTETLIAAARQSAALAATATVQSLRAGETVAASQAAAAAASAAPPADFVAQSSGLTANCATPSVSPPHSPPSGSARVYRDAQRDSAPTRCLYGDCSIAAPVGEHTEAAAQAAVAATAGTPPAQLAAQFAGLLGQLRIPSPPLYARPSHRAAHPALAAIVNPSLEPQEAASDRPALPHLIALANISRQLDEWAVQTAGVSAPAEYASQGSRAQPTRPSFAHLDSPGSSGTQGRGGRRGGRGDFGCRGIGSWQRQQPISTNQQQPLPASCGSGGGGGRGGDTRSPAGEGAPSRPAAAGQQRPGGAAGSKKN